VDISSDQNYIVFIAVFGSKLKELCGSHHEFQLR
jgi:hypothetical protein